VYPIGLTPTRLVDILDQLKISQTSISNPQNDLSICHVFFDEGKIPDLMLLTTNRCTGPRQRIQSSPGPMYRPQPHQQQHLRRASSLELNEIDSRDDPMHILRGCASVELSNQFCDVFDDALIERLMLHGDSVAAFGRELKHLTITPCPASPDMLRRLLEKENAHLAGLNVGPLAHPMSTDVVEAMRDVADSFTWC